MVTLEQAESIANIIQAIGIGIGSVIGGLGALKIFGEWQSKRKYKRLKRKWLGLYPKDSFKKDFKLIVHSYSKDDSKVKVLGRSPHIYIGDDRTKTKHWIANPATLKLLGFNSDEVEGVSKKELESYGMGEEIDLDPDSYS